MLEKLKETMKDVVKFNFWTCIFVLPISVTSIFAVYYEQAYVVNLFLAKIYEFSNPVIYLTIFTKIRQYWKSSNQAAPTIQIAPTIQEAPTIQVASTN